jgi:hypothetical protein
VFACGKVLEGYLILPYSGRDYQSWHSHMLMIEPSYHVTVVGSLDLQSNDMHVQKLRTKFWGRGNQKCSYSKSRRNNFRES